ncbi:flagellar basal body P-ring protein FlgI [Selenomonas sp. KH1T6]|uniref:flagellar basal body P-ring protein FlgI n=1 Tax=Selenomonas sp. KH1T6 TaxID=3158784 RepID=UPI0008A80C5A|nr:flagellar P-ring protein precursor FlgI [Selenomonas ruminantium]
MKKILALALAAFMLILSLPQQAGAESAPTRIKDIAKVQGVRSNQLIGYGIVVGLAGTGDSKEDTKQSIRNMLLTFGITVPENDLKLDNSAAVMVTATLPPFVREGDTIDVTTSSIGDADSLQGGTLLQTPLRAANGVVYAVAQGPVSTGGFVAGNGGGSAQKNFPTVGLTPNGAIVEKTMEEDLGRGGKISLSLYNPDFTTAARMAASINAQYGGIATAANPGRIDINIPAYFRGNVVGFVATIEELPIVPDNRARVVVNERTGTIVMGGEVAVNECAITQGGISIRVARDEQAVQPDPLSYGTTIVTNNTTTEAEEDVASTVVVPATASISDIVGALNAVGATARDTISILQAMKAAGAIHADLEII